MNRPVIPLRLLICLALAAITFGLYWPVQTHDYICFDDPQFVTENPIIQSGLNWKSIVWAFTHSVAVNWHPVTTLSHALDCQLFGVNPGAHHLVNAFFHSINGALLFLLLARMTGFTWRSAVVAGVFALHPLRVESVAWLAERKDVLSGFFFMLTLLAYAAYSKSKQSSVISEQSSEKRARHQPSAINYQPFRYYALTLLCFALGLMSKPMLVTLPFVLLLLDFWPLRRIKLLTTDANRVGNQQRSTVGYQLSTINYQLFRRCLAEKLPFFAVSAIGCAVTMHMQGVVAQYNASLPMSERINNAVVSYLRYLGKLFWPTKLTIIYPHPFSSYAHSLRWDAWQIAVAALFLLGITLICLWLSRRKPYLATSWGAGDGGSLHLHSPYWPGHQPRLAHLRMFRLDAETKPSPGSGFRGRTSNLPGFVPSTNRFLAKQFDAFFSCAGCGDSNSHHRVWRGSGPGTSGQAG